MCRKNEKGKIARYYEARLDAIHNSLIVHTININNALIIITDNKATIYEIAVRGRGEGRICKRSIL
jgi:hypothetical protein